MKIGAYIVGVSHVMGLLVAIVRFSLGWTSLEIFCGVSFLYMIWKDSLMTRLYYFVAYCCYSGIAVAIRMVFIFWSRDENLKIRIECTKIEEETVMADPPNTNGWAATPYTDKDDCMTQMGLSVEIWELSYLVVSLLV